MRQVGPATYITSVAVEYESGYSEGYAQGEALLDDQASAFVPETEATLREAVRVSARLFSRAFALGMLRGFRHATWSVR